MKRLINQIREKETELNDLKEKYNEEIVAEKKKILESKSSGLTKSLYLLGFKFESNSGRTYQYLEFHKVFEKEFTILLKPFIKKIEVSKPNHFDVTGFFELNNSEIYYFSIGDLRWDKQSMLIRTARDFRDYSGGSNGYVLLNNDFVSNLLKYLRLEKKHEHCHKRLNHIEDDKD